MGRLTRAFYEAVSVEHPPFRYAVQRWTRARAAYLDPATRDKHRGQELRDARRAAGVEVRTVARLLGLTGAIVVELETGRREFVTARQYDDAVERIRRHALAAVAGELRPWRVPGG